MEKKRDSNRHNFAGSSLITFLEGGGDAKRAQEREMECMIGGLVSEVSL